jgi:hypothetical protein
MRSTSRNRLSMATTGGDVKPRNMSSRKVSLEDIMWPGAAVAESGPRRPRHHPRFQQAPRLRVGRRASLSGGAARPDGRTDRHRRAPEALPSRASSCGAWNPALAPGIVLAQTAYAAARPLGHKFSNFWEHAVDVTCRRRSRLRGWVAVESAGKTPAIRVKPLKGCSLSDMTGAERGGCGKQGAAHPRATLAMPLSRMWT